MTNVLHMTPRTTRPSAFEALYRELNPSLLRYLGRLTGDEDAAEDVAQEAFVRLLRRPELRGEDARVWLFTVATNLVRDRSRSITRRRRLLEANPLLPASLGRPDEEAERSAEIARVRAALAQLAERDRQLLLMREEGFSYAEIARAVEVAPGSVGTLIARALKRFGSVYRVDREVPDAR
jgi:RNA polymerase sigma-70 factor (ECF subfamily)